MKKVMIGLMVAVLVVFFAAQAFAGVLDTVLDTVKDFVTSSAVHGAITALFAILTGIFGAGVFRFKKPVILLYDVYCEYRDAKLKDSQGGDKVTREEWDEIFKKFGEVVMSLLVVAPGRWAKRLRTTV